MANLSQSFFFQVERLERSFGVSFVLYQKYNETFKKLFLIFATERKTKKSRPGKCSANKLYEFCWNLFICAKGEEPKHTVDLVTSFHLLLCCIDLIFANAIADNRKDIINPNFEGLPKVWTTTDNDQISDKPYCIMSALCRLHDVSYLDAQNMKEYSWRNIIGRFLKHETLQGNENTFLEITSSSNFEANLKSLNKTYEQYVLSVGEFDERVFLNNYDAKELNSSSDPDVEKERQSQINASIRSLVPGTPLTRRHYLPNKDISEPVANATQNVKRLQLIAEKEVSMDFLKQAGEVIVMKFQTRLKAMCEIFSERYSTKSEANKRFDLAKSLYSYLLDKIIKIELKIKPNLDLKILLDTDIFHITLIACCVEIVLVAYNSQIKFPWVLECFNVPAFHFCKIIEIVVIRHDDALTRSLIKHLNAIEENCLESLVWRNTSPLWEAVKQWNQPLPSWVHVDNRNSNNTIDQIKRNDTTSFEKNVLQSPVNSACDSFNQSAVLGEASRKDLFNVSKTENVFEMPTGGFALNCGELNGRKKIGSLSLFFRKFYKLAYMRILELCKELSIKNDDYLKQIWTLFEYTIVHKTELMRDRHLDQIIMCAIYAFIKVKDIPGKTFTDIMKFYRNQPQAASNVYREVLIQPTVKVNDGSDSLPAVYKDIIYFYNSVYVQNMSPYILNFGERTNSQSSLLLSPHPPEKMHSPKKILSNHHLYIQPLDKKDILQSPNQITYEFCKSPAKDLERINQIVKNSKRILPFSDDEPAPSKIVRTTNFSPSTSYITKKIHGLIRDRQEEEIKE